MAFAYTSPGKAVGYVNDFAGVLQPAERAALEAKLAAFDKQTTDQVAVVTVSSLGGDTIENYAVKLFEEWGIGQRGSDNGVLVLVSTGDHQARIEVGYGLEPTITDAAASVIVRDVMIPAFKQGDYYSGLDGAADRIIGLIQNDPETARFIQQNVGQGSDQSASGASLDPFYLIFFVFIIGLNLLGVMARSRSWWLGGVIGAVVGLIFLGLVGAGICAVVGLAVDFVLSRYGSNWFKGPNGPRGPRGPWFLGGGGFRGGGGGGGFGGFGGGGSGGGGASGGW